jgi:GLPGLI family protein
MKKLSVFFLLFILFIGNTVHAQISKNRRTATKRGTTKTNLTISYNIIVLNSSKKTGVEESYNGGNKTIFISGDKARLRLVSLMRIQSIFLYPADSKKKIATIVKESGTGKYKMNLTAAQYAALNSKYDSIQCELTEDTLTFLNYLCKKAIIHLKDEHSITAWYCPELKAVAKNIEPAFACIPGLVLHYEVVNKKKSLVFTVASISNKPVDPNLFKIPSKGYKIKKLCSTCPNKEVEMDDEDDSLNDTEEEKKE